MVGCVQGEIGPRSQSSCFLCREQRARVIIVLGQAGFHRQPQTKRETKTPRKQKRRHADQKKNEKRCLVSRLQCLGHDATHPCRVRPRCDHSGVILQDGDAAHGPLVGLDAAKVVHAPEGVIAVTVARAGRAKDRQLHVGEERTVGNTGKKRGRHRRRRDTEADTDWRLTRRAWPAGGKQTRDSKAAHADAVGGIYVQDEDTSPGALGAGEGHKVSTGTTATLARR